VRVHAVRSRSSRLADASYHGSRVGDTRLQGGDRAGALAAYEESLDIFRKLVAQDPDNAQAQTELVLSLYRMTIVGDTKQARAALTEALSIAETLQREQKLTAEQKGWPDDLRAGLSKLH
jgi:tetratricopeptide (TPR) repeat protein